MSTAVFSPVVPARAAAKEPVAKVLCFRERGISRQIEAEKRRRIPEDSMSFDNEELA
jgi:hypothetical protein